MYGVVASAALCSRARPSDPASRVNTGPIGPVPGQIVATLGAREGYQALSPGIDRSFGLQLGSQPRMRLEPVCRQARPLVRIFVWLGIGRAGSATPRRSSTRPAPDFIIGPAGEVVTNSPVVADARQSRRQPCNLACGQFTLKMLLPSAPMPGSIAR